jgi:hypothetical protein
MNKKTRNDRAVRTSRCGIAVAVLASVTMLSCTDSSVTDESLGLQTLLAAAGQDRELERGDHDGRNKPYPVRGRDTAGFGELNQVWFEATAGAEGAVLSQGAGHKLKMECVSFGGPVQCEWTVQMLLSSIESLSSWDAGLFTKAGEESGLEVLGFTYDLTQFTAPNGGETFGTPPDLLVGTGASTPEPAGVAPGTYTLVELSLRLDFDGVDVGQRLIRTRVGELGWTGPSGNPPMIQFGDNAPVEASPAALPSDPTIVIDAVLAVEICDDGIDNDRDDLIDCDDPDCADAPNCTAPILTCPDDLTVECDGSGNTADFGTWVNSETVESVCDNLSVSNEVIEVTDGCGGTAAAEVSWAATDGCGTDMCSATFSTEDTAAPSISDVENLTLECNPAANPGEIDQWLAGVTADDICSLVEVTNDFDTLSDECGKTGSATVTWTATDDCGNSATTSAMVTVEDTTPPSISGIEDRTVECDGGGNITDVDGWLAAAAAEDACGNTDLSDDFAGLSDDCGETGAATVTWTATDDCGNEATAPATFTVEDTTAPSISGVEDVTVECDGDGNTADLEGWLGGASVADTCGDASLSDDFAGLSDECGATGSAMVTWTGTDDCGNQTTESATFTIEDSTPPTITGIEDLTVECDGAGNTEDLEAWLASPVVTEDTCGETTVETDFDGLTDGCSETGSAEVNWTAVDDCGNAASLAAMFTIEDTTPPEITLNGEAEMVVECGVDSYEEPGATVTDVCDGQDISGNVGGDDVDEATPGTYVVTYEAEDECGNASDQVMRTVKVVDTMPPVVIVEDMVELWPPNHKYKSFSLSDCARVADECEGDLDVNDIGTILSIYSDEPEDVGGLGDGRTRRDIVVLIDGQFRLRAERQGGGDGRVYGVTFEVSDSAGNASQHTCYFGVPHDQDGQAPIDAGPDAGYTVVP